MIGINSLRVGDKILVDPDLHPGDDYKIYVGEFMAELAGRYVTVAEILYSSIRIEEDGKKYLWTNDMFLSHEPMFPVRLSDYIM